jgi:hypothetical protein
VQGVLAAEDRERARAAGQPDHSARVAQQDLPDAGVVLVALVAQPGVIVEVTARLGLWYITVTENSLLSKCQPSSSPAPKIAISRASSGSALR